MAISGVRETTVSEYRDRPFHATLYRVSPKRHRIDTFDERDIRGTYLSVTVGGEAAARREFRAAVTRIMEGMTE